MLDRGHVEAVLGGHHFLSAIPGLATVAVPHRASGVLQEALRFYSGLTICIFPVVGVGSRFLLLLVVSSDGIVAVAPAPQRAQENFPCFEHKHRLLCKLVGLVVASH